MQFADIAVNLGDPMFQGLYHGRQKHNSDLPAVISRARAAGVSRQLVTGTSLAESRVALALAREHALHSTAGCHPTSTNEINQHPGGIEAYFLELEELIRSDRGEGGSRRIISIGEIGLDYDRLHFAARETQLFHLPRLLRLSQTFKLPLFLHSRHPEAHTDLVRTLREVGWSTDNRDGWAGGVAHSFTGTVDEMRELISLGLYIGINGCSLKTTANLDVVRQIPLERILLETDAPWCGTTSTHASQKYIPKDLSIVDKVKPEKWAEGKGVKGRNEPAEVVIIAHIIASIRGIPVEDVARAAWDNSKRLFFSEEAT